MTLREITIRAIDSALSENRGNKTKAAAQLDISIRTLRNWVNKEPELAHWIILSPRWPSTWRAA